MRTWKPHLRQEEALMVNPSQAFEILYGGSRGGGKTDCGFAWLLYDSEHPLYRALVIRRNADDLRDWIDRARYFYTNLGSFVGNPPELRLNSGGVVRTGHLKDENAYTKYQGHEYQRILIEELTHIPSQDYYLKLLASCRSTIEEIRPQTMANCNPDGPGFSWVKRRWGLEGTPEDAVWTTDERTGLKRVFIPSRVFDNPTIIERDPQYVEMLKGLPDGLREAWLHGSWSDPLIPGAYYTEALLQARKENRIGSVPHDASKQVFTVWDLGIGPQLVCLFVQREGKNVHIIDRWQGVGSDGMPQAKKMLDEKPYVYGAHFAPHDVSRTEAGTGQTVLETARDLGIEFQPVPNLKVRDGIFKALMMISRVSIDEAKCEQFIEALRQYRREWDEKKLDWVDRPLKDWTNHDADAFRYVALVEDMMQSDFTTTHVYIPDEV